MTKRNPKNLLDAGGDRKSIQRNSSGAARGILSKILNITRTRLREAASGDKISFRLEPIDSVFDRPRNASRV
jgi:ribosomal protein S14